MRTHSKKSDELGPPGDFRAHQTRRKSKKPGLGVSLRKLDVSASGLFGELPGTLIKLIGEGRACNFDGCESITLPMNIENAR